MSESFTTREVPIIKEYVLAMLAYAFRSGAIRNTLLAYFLVCGMIIYNIFRSPSFQLTGLLFLFVLFGVGYYVFFRMFLNIKQLHQSLIRDTSYFLQIDHKGVHTQNASRETIETWKQYDAYFETRKLFVLVLSSKENSLLVVPKRLFAEGIALEDFRKLLSESLPEKNKKDQQARRAWIAARRKPLIVFGLLYLTAIILILYGILQSN